MSVPVSVLVVMGVSGCGKTTLATALADALGWPFKEGDELHPGVNIAKMAAGRPLDDADRRPWLDAVGDWIDRRRTAGDGGVITCSALKRSYRERLTAGRPEVIFAFIRLEREIIAERLARRTCHFMPASLLDSQLADLEPPDASEPAVAVDGLSPLPEQVAAVLAAVQRRVRQSD